MDGNDLRQTEPLSQMTRFILTVFAFSLPLMCLGWMVIAWMPVWMSPPLEQAGTTLALYFFGLMLPWLVVVLRLFTKWDKSIMAFGDFWLIPLLTLIWLGGVFIALSLGNGGGLLYIVVGDSETGSAQEICEITTEDMLIRYNCQGCMVCEGCDLPEDDEWTFSRTYIVFGCWYYTFEGRDTLPIVRRTSGGLQSANPQEITP